MAGTARGMSLVAYGDLNVDLCLWTDALPERGQDAIVEQCAMYPGGSAANCACVAAKLGARVEFLGVTGDDALAKILIDDLNAHGVGITYLRVVSGSPGVIVSITTPDGERSFLSYRNTNDLGLEAVPLDVLDANDILHVSGYSFQSAGSKTSALVLMQQAKSVGARVSLDPSFHFARDLAVPEIFPLLDFIFPNADEARLLTGESSPETAAAKLRAMGCKTVVVKLGADGCLMDSAAGREHVPAYLAVHVEDTIGAGDAFCGGFLTAALWGLRESDAAKVGHAAAVHIIGQAGGHQGAATLGELAAFLQQRGAVTLVEELLNRRDGEGNE